MVDSNEEDFIKRTLFRRKATYLQQKDVVVEVKQKHRAAQSVGRAPVEMRPQDASRSEASPHFSEISEDIWNLIAAKIPPEDVQRFAMVCPQTAKIVKTRGFWQNLYRKYCQMGTGVQWIVGLPEALQPASIKAYPNGLVRVRVIEALFYCHEPFKERIKKGYKIDSLLGRIYVSSQHFQNQCIWIACYKFWRDPRKTAFKFNVSPVSAMTTVSNWESLADGNDSQCAGVPPPYVNPHEGVSLLVIMGNHYVSLPHKLLYESDDSRFRLKATRQMLATNMRESSLELDFVDRASQVITTMKHPEILKYNVLPWWHPAFKRFTK